MREARCRAPGKGTGINSARRYANHLASATREAENEAMALEFTTSYLKDTTEVLRYYKRLGERAMEQAPDAALFAMLDGESNSIAILVKHMAGNMRSRWTDFLTTDGEKPGGNGETKFQVPRTSHAHLMAHGERGGNR